MTDAKPAKKRPRPSPQNGSWPAEVAPRIGVSLNYLYRLMKAGKVRTVSLGPRTNIIPDDEVLRLEGKLPEAGPQ